MGADHSLVGRERQLGALDRLMLEARRGRGRLVEVVGEPGIGKTRLLAEVCARADARQWLVLTGRASEFERDVPFAIVTDALDDYLGSVDPVFLEALGEERLQELGTVLPTFGRRVSAGATLLQSERYRVHRALRAVLEHLARRRPLLLALDDLHWADAATTELLAFCCGVLPLAAVVIAAAFRPRQAPAPLTMALAAAERQGNVERLELGPLSLEETRALLGPDVGTEAAVVLYRESGGNPFYLEQLARVPGAASPADGRSQTTVGTAIPPAVIAALGEELVALSTPARRLLQGAAVVGDPFEPDLAADAAGLTEAEALALLDELIEIDLGATDRRSPPLPFSPPDRSPSRVRVGRGGVAARSPRTGGPGSRARPSSRAPNGPNNARGRRLYPVRASSALTVDGYHCCLPEREGSRPRSVDGRWR